MKFCSHDRVPAKRAEAEEQTKRGIIIPTTGKEKPEEGRRRLGAQDRMTRA